MPKWRVSSVSYQSPMASHACIAPRGAVIEIMFGRLKDWRRVATRYDRCPKVFLSAIALAALFIYWL
ncbi:transposase [Phycobacter azelaicus]|uniref:transposase n=1 Tax=Phycobacter azelaicus TaxID=2668075 RepID=UPI003F6F1301